MQKKITLACFLLSLFCIQIGCEKNSVESDPPQTVNLTILSFAPAMARVGDTVRVAGTGFGSNLSVANLSIGTVAAELLTITDTSISLVVQAGTQTGLLNFTIGTQTTVSSTALTIDNTLLDPWTQKTTFPVNLPNASGFANVYIPAAGISAGNRGFYYKSNKLWEYLPATNSWLQKASRPSVGNAGQSQSSGFVINDKIYFALTDVLDGADSVQLWAYSLTTDSWERKKRFPGPDRIGPFSFALNGKGYVGGGQMSRMTTINYQDMWKYDPATNDWTQVANYPGTVTLGISGFNIGVDKAYVLDAGAGNPRAPLSGTGSQGNLYRYNDTTNSWTQKASLPGATGIVSASCYSMSGKAFVNITRPSTPATATIKNDFWEYQQQTNTWVQRADVGGGLRWFGTGFTINNRAYVSLGTANGSTSYKTDFWEYNPEP